MRFASRYVTTAVVVGGLLALTALPALAKKNPLKEAYFGETHVHASAIKDGKVVTSIGNHGYELTVYKVGDKYFGARSNEFGYANYEVVPAPVNLNNLGTAEKSPF